MSRYPSASDALSAAARHGWRVRVHPAAGCAPALCEPVTGVVVHGEWGEFAVDGEQVPGWIERIEVVIPDASTEPLFVAGLPLEVA